MRPLPEISAQTAAATIISAQRAANLVVEARAERDAFITNLIENGLPDYITPSGDFSENMDRCRAHEAFRHYYEYELVHTPFSHPEFPEDPAATMRQASADLVESDGNWGGSWGDSWILSQETDNISP
ncbi:hypothetical protein B0H14DRAFT_3514598 [Mycena olivaceomarginata]|nr:hypothetical protein B0H14DRAFT_3514598 [Mycena olivaceomarginata]